MHLASFHKDTVSAFLLTFNLLHASLKPFLETPVWGNSLSLWPGLYANLPGVTAALNYSPRQVRLVSLHTGTHGDGDTLTLMVQHQPWWALATWETRLDAWIIFIFTVAVMAIWAGATTRTTTLLVQLAPWALDRWVGGESKTGVHADVETKNGT